MLLCFKKKKIMIQLALPHMDDKWEDNKKVSYEMYECIK